MRKILLILFLLFFFFPLNAYAQVHNWPTTTSSLSPSPSTVGNHTFYSDPVTVTLSATADSGYDIAHTYYKVDGAGQQTYSAAFTVSGTGAHSVEYWSVDNSGIEELPRKSSSFTIGYRQAVINSITQDATNIGVTVTFDDFTLYTSQLYNNDCNSDSGALIEIYNADTGALVSSRTDSGGMCGSGGTGNTAWLAFPPLVLPTGTYWIHYSGGGFDWITENYTFNAPVPAHNKPTTTSSLSPSPSTVGNHTFYSDPVTVTLSATADSGYDIAHTYYKVDGAGQQTYSAAFTVSGTGAHSVEYWSVDNSGIEELPARIAVTHTNRVNVMLWLSIEDSPHQPCQIWPQDWNDNSANLRFTVRLPQELVWPPTNSSRILLDVFDTGEYTQSGGTMTEFSAAFGGHTLTSSEVVGRHDKLTPWRHEN